MTMARLCFQESEAVEVYLYGVSFKLDEVKPALSSSVDRRGDAQIIVPGYNRDFRWTWSYPSSVGA